jgi:hypothetical protein
MKGPVKTPALSFFGNALRLSESGGFPQFFV